MARTTKHTPLSLRAVAQTAGAAAVLALATLSKGADARKMLNWGGRGWGNRGWGGYAPQRYGGWGGGGYPGYGYNGYNPGYGGGYPGYGGWGGGGSVAQANANAVAVGGK